MLPEEKQPRLTFLDNLPADLKNELLKMLEPNELRSLRDRPTSPGRTSWKELVDDYVQRLTGGSLPAEAALELWEEYDAEFYLIIKYYTLEAYSGAHATLGQDVRVESFAESAPDRLKAYIRILLARGRLEDLRERVRDSNGNEIANPGYGKPLDPNTPVDEALNLWKRGEVRWLPPQQPPSRPAGLEIPF